MQIDAKQATALSRAQAAGFDLRALEFLKAEFSEVAQRADEGRLMRFVKHGRHRAELHGFVSERNIVLYLLAMMHLGPMFDEDPEFTALRPQLDGASPVAPETRLRILLAAAAERPRPGVARAA